MSPTIRKNFSPHLFFFKVLSRELISKVSDRRQISITRKTSKNLLFSGDSTGNKLINSLSSLS